MLKNIFIYLIIVLLLGIMYLSSSRQQMEKISAARVSADTWWGIYRSRGGDLCDMAYLDFISDFHNSSDQVHYTVKNGGNDIDLYLRGDSYSRSIPSNAYSFLSNFTFSNHWDTAFAYRLDRTKKNVLIFEISERFLRQDYRTPAVTRYFADITQMSSNAAPEKSGKSNFLATLFNKNINQNLQYNLFNYRFISPLFEGKAALNFYLWGRTSGDVVLSDDKKFLLLRETMTQTGDRSSFSKLRAGEIDSIVNALNIINDHYRAEGFCDVYFCIIPNPVSVLQPDAAYNGLLPAVQNNRGLRTKMIDLYDEFRLRPENYYEHGDTHWNNQGKLVWINKVNEILETIHSQQPAAPL